jgi:putative endonuclease
MFLKKHIELGKNGEDIAVHFLRNKGFSIRERNFRKKCGEIDIIAQKDKTIHFIEVKTITGLISSRKDSYEPEEKVNFQKKKRLARVIELYLYEKNEEESDFFIDVCAIIIEKGGEKYSIKFIEDVELL